MRRGRQLLWLGAWAVLAAWAPAARGGEQTAAQGRPAAPQQPAAGGGARVLALTLKEAVLRAIRNNPDADIARLDVAAAYAGIEEAWGSFDPALFLGTSGGRNRDPSFSAPIPGTDITVTGLPPGLRVDPSDSFAWNGGVRWQSLIGTGIELRYDYGWRTTASRFFLDPAVRPSFTASVRQPLLRNFGLDVNKTFVTVARHNHAMARAQLEAALVQLAFEVEQAYWTYLGARETEKVAEQALRTARELLERAEAQLRAGAAIPLDVLQARVGVATREEELIRARNDAANAADALLRLITAPGQHRAWDVRVVALDAPRIDPEPLDVNALIADALGRRPELQALQTAIAAETARRELADNQRLPSVDLVASWTQLGLGDSHHNAHEALFTGEFYRWSVGLEVEVPIFNLAARGAAEAAQARVRRAERQRDSLEQVVVLEVRTAARDIAAARERVRSARLSVELAEQQLEAEQVRLRHGAATNFDVLEKEEALSAARRLEIAARIDHALAKARLLRARGRTLEQLAIDVEP